MLLECFCTASGRIKSKNMAGREGRDLLKEKYRMREEQAQEEGKQEEEEWGDARDDSMMQDQPSFSTPKRSSTAGRFQQQRQRQQRQTPTPPQETEEDLNLSRVFGMFLGPPVKKVNSPNVFERVKYDAGKHKTKYNYLVFDEITIKRSENEEPMYDLPKPQYQDRQAGKGMEDVRKKLEEFQLLWNYAVKNYEDSFEKSAQDAAKMVIPEGVINDICNNVNETLELKSDKIFNKLLKELENKRGPSGEQGERRKRISWNSG